MINSNKKHFYVFILIVFFIFAHKASASILFNEISLNPTEGRFIELYNNGDSDIDLTGYYIQRKTATGTEFSSLVSKTLFEGKKIRANDYFLISKSISNSDIILDSLTITESNTLQIKNNNQEVVDKVGWGDSLECNTVCGSNPQSGQSISKSSGDWIISSCTPGEQNGGQQVESIVDNTSNEAEESTASSNSSSSSSKAEEKIYKIATKIIAPKIVVANIPFMIDHQTTGVHKEKVILGKFVWNFGDGMTKEFSVSDPFPYIYYYPGDYVVSLSFYDSVFSKEPDAVDRLNIKVIPSGISISSVGNLSDPFIEIYNNSNYEMPLRDWTIKGASKSFVIPNDTVILPGKKIKLSPKITGFDFSDLEYISITDKDGQIFATYPKYNDYHIGNSNYKILSNKASNKIENKETEVVDLNNLEANALKSSGRDLDMRNIYPWAILTLVIIIGSASIILIRKKDDYDDYIEKEVSAKDMTIIE